MKKEIKKEIFFLFVVVAYSFQAILNTLSDSYIYVLAVIVSVALLYIIKNKYIGAFAGLAVLAAMEFYDPYYKYLSVIAFLLICAHKNYLSDITVSDKKKKNEMSGFSFFIVQTCLFLSIALLIYSIILYPENQIGENAFFLNRSLLIFFWLIGIFIYSIFNVRKKNKDSSKTDKQLSGNLRFLYLVSIIAFSATVLFSCSKRWYVSFSYNVIFLPWFVFICSLVYNEDPYIESISEKIQSFMVKISNNDKVKK